VSRHPSPHRRGASLLLEVVVAIAILTTAMGFLGAQLVRGLEMTEYNEEQLRAAQMTDRILALIAFDPEVQQYLFAAEEEQSEYDFDSTDELAYWGLRNRYPDYLWRATAERVDPDSDELYCVEVAIYHQPDPDLQGNFDDAKLVRRIAFLRAKPASINLEELNEQMLQEQGVSEELMAQIPDLLGLLGGFETNNVPIQQLIAMLDEETLRTYMPLIQQLLGELAGGGLPGDLGALAGQLGGGAAEQAVMEALQGAGGSPMRRPGPGGQPPGGRPRGPRRGGQQTPAPDQGADENLTPQDLIGEGSGPNGEYTIEDLMRMREEYERRQGGGGGGGRRGGGRRG
jgi:hypothetical protein